MTNLCGTVDGKAVPQARERRMQQHHELPTIGAIPPQPCRQFLPSNL